MYNARQPHRRLFVDQYPGNDRLHAPQSQRALTLRDRVALGYYDSPELTEAAVTRMLQIFNGNNN